MENLNGPNPVAWSNVPIGTILSYLAPAASAYGAGWLPCDGSLIPTQCSLLISIIGSNTPNLNGLVLVGSGLAASGTNYTLGPPHSPMPIGEEKHVLSIDEMPSHNHPVGGKSGFWRNPDGGNWEDLLGAVTVDSGLTGGGLAHNNMQPYYVVTYIVYAGSELLTN